LTAPQIVFITTAVAVSAAIALVCVGVALLAGEAWSLICAGALIGPTAVGAGVVLLRDDGRAK
jgi:hypothetical protein